MVSCQTVTCVAQHNARLSWNVMNKQYPNTLSKPPSLEQINIIQTRHQLRHYFHVSVCEYKFGHTKNNLNAKIVCQCNPDFS